MVSRMENIDRDNLQKPNPLKLSIGSMCNGTPNQKAQQGIAIVQQGANDRIEWFTKVISLNLNSICFPRINDHFIILVYASGWTFLVVGRVWLCSSGYPRLTTQNTLAFHRQYCFKGTGIFNSPPGDTDATKFKELPSKVKKALWRDSEGAVISGHRKDLFKGRNQHRSKP